MAYVKFMNFFISFNIIGISFIVIYEYLLSSFTIWSNYVQMWNIVRLGMHAML